MRDFCCICAITCVTIKVKFLSQGSHLVKQHRLPFLLSLSLLFSATPVLGQNIYRWTDAQGRLHFSNAPVYEATAVDDELPPATSFGGAQEPAPQQTAPSTAPQADSPTTTAAVPPTEDDSEDDAEPANNEETVPTDGEPVAAEDTVESEPGESATDNSDTEPLPQTSVDFSEREEAPPQTVASEVESPSPIEEEANQPALRRRSR